MDEIEAVVKSICSATATKASQGALHSQLLERCAADLGLVLKCFESYLQSVASDAMGRKRCFSLIFDILTRYSSATATATATATASSSSSSSSSSSPVFSPVAFPLVLHLSLLGIGDVWSENRTACGRAAAQLCSTSFSSEQTSTYAEELRAGLERELCDAGKWQKSEGLLQASTSLVTRFSYKPDGNASSSNRSREAASDLPPAPPAGSSTSTPPSSFLSFGGRLVPAIPSPLAIDNVAGTIFRCLDHPQVRVREAAISFLRALLRRVRAADEHRIEALLEEVTERLKVLQPAIVSSSPHSPSSSSPSHSLADGLLQALSAIADSLSPPSLEVRWPDAFAAALPFLRSDASTVRQRAAALLQGLATKDDEPIRLLGVLMRMAASSGDVVGAAAAVVAVSDGGTATTTPKKAPAPVAGGDDKVAGCRTPLSFAEQASCETNVDDWQYQEGRLIAYEAILSESANAYLFFVGGGIGTPSVLAAISSSPLLLSSFLQALDLIRGQVAAVISSPQFELRRIAAMVLSQLARIAAWLAPSSLGLVDTAWDRSPNAGADPLLDYGRLSVETDLLRAALRHARHIAEELCAACEGGGGGGGGGGGEVVAAAVVKLGKSGERWGASHDGIADCAVAQGASISVAKAVRGDRGRCREMIDRMRALAKNEWSPKLSAIARVALSSSEEQTVVISVVEVLILLRTFWTNTWTSTSEHEDPGSTNGDDDVALVATQICALHKVAYPLQYDLMLAPVESSIFRVADSESEARCPFIINVVMPLNKYAQSLSESPLSSKKRESLPGSRCSSPLIFSHAAKRAGYVDSLLLSGLLKYIASYCEHFSGAKGLWWARFVLVWLCLGEGSNSNTEKLGTQWRGTSLPVVDVFVKLLVVLRGLLERGQEAAANTLAAEQDPALTLKGVSDVCIAHLGTAIKSGHFDCGGGGGAANAAINPSVLRAVLDVVLFAVVSGKGELTLNFLQTLGTVMDREKERKEALTASLQAKSDAGRSAGATSGGGGAQPGNGLKVETEGPEFIQPFPTTPDKTPKFGVVKASSTPKKPDVVNDWDDWDEEDEDDTVPAATESSTGNTPVECLVLSFLDGALRESGVITQLLSDRDDLRVALRM